ncbi:hypothetical protein BCR41DRAFT_53291 [Lobosporangium transversale]|uniref:Uncharacterized protein n=1 Tax=Lobosporangium transversale TaxID=64571 RepID=A0A1Y2GQ13_9FUNG|nr:hypothetical protein BCR41DRAFT_53291 [Lobosporangium transversale]ORZ16684.1 hypothetical protein BCR41DRAFT_53291 [Lobosporangium transversale]|eukprot:XP_021881619.1 hypothetical protein BCR41DRAFT_53291 [Lobosporangium transversale]
MALREAMQHHKSKRPTITYIFQLYTRILFTLLISPFTELSPLLLSHLCGMCTSCYKHCYMCKLCIRMKLVPLWYVACGMWHVACGMWRVH